MKKQIAIIVVTYNRITLLKECIESLRAQTNTDGQIIVVNNGSTDGTLEWLNEQSDILTISQKNLGGAGGFFTGMKYAAENGYKYSWLMDDDVICSPDALKELYIAYHRKDDIGFVCSKVIGNHGYMMNTPVIDDRANEQSLYQDWADMLEYGMVKVRKATFASLFLSTETIMEFGLPYKEYFIWADDHEYTQRISNKYCGYMVGKSVVTHKRNIQQRLFFETETEPKRIEMYFYMFRNSWHYQNNFSSYKQRVDFVYARIKEGLRMMKHGEVKKGEVTIKAALALLTFNPSICYPDRNKITLQDD